MFRHGGGVLDQEPQEQRGTVASLTFSLVEQIQSRQHSVSNACFNCNDTSPHSVLASPFATAM